MKNSNSDSSPVPIQPTMPPPPRQIQPQKSSTIDPRTSGTSESRGTYSKSYPHLSPRQNPLSAGGGDQSTAPRPASFKPATTAKPPNERSVSSGSSVSTERSRGSTHSALSREACRHRVRDQEEQNDLLRRRSDSPGKSRPSQPQARADAPEKKSSVFGRFRIGKRKDERIGDG